MVWYGTVLYETDSLVLALWLLAWGWRALGWLVVRIVLVVIAVAAV